MTSLGIDLCRLWPSFRNRRKEALVTTLNCEFAAYDLNVAVYRDWDSLTLKRQFDVPSGGFSGSGSPSQWVSSFGSEVARGNSLGLGRAVQLKISGPGSATWGVNGVTFNYNPRGYKP